MDDEDGRAARDRGMDRVTSNTHPAWIALADRAILELARTRTQPFAAADLTDIVGMPERPNAVGARFSAAARRGWIVATGFRQATRGSRHASRSLTWLGTFQRWQCLGCRASIDASSVRVYSLPGRGEAPCASCGKIRAVAAL